MELATSFCGILIDVILWSIAQSHLMRAMLSTDILSIDSMATAKWAWFAPHLRVSTFLGSKQKIAPRSGISDQPLLPIRTDEPLPDRCLNKLFTYIS